MRGVTLVDGHTQAPVRVLVEQRPAGRHAPERLTPRRDDPLRRAIPGQPQGRTPRQVPERRAQVAGLRAKLQVAERVHVQDRGHQRPGADFRRGPGQPDQAVDGEFRAQRREGHAGRQVGRGGGEDVAPVERARDDRQAMGGGRQQPRVDDPAEPLRRGQQQAVVRADQDVATVDPHGDRPPLRPHARVDHRHVGPDRQVRRSAPQEKGAVADLVLGHVVRDVDHVRLRRDAQDDGPHDARRRVAQAEVAEEADEGSVDHAGMVGGATA